MRTFNRVALASIVAFAMVIVFGETVMRALYDDITGTPTDVDKFLREIGVK